MSNGEPSLPGDVCAGAGAESDRGDLARWLQETQSAAAIEPLAARIAQEYTRLLATMMGTADLLSGAGTEGADALANVEDLIESVRDGADLTRLLLVIGRGETASPRVVDPNAVVADVARLLGRVVRQGVELVTATTPSCWDVVADPGKLALALINLAVNARDAMPNGGTLHLRTENVVVLDGVGARDATDVPTGEYAALIVEDTGHGIPETDLPKIFDPLFTTKCRVEHRGLGLATVAGIVRQSGGFLSVESVPGTGSTFTILLPRSSQRIAADAASTSAAHTRKAELVLVVEEDAAVRLTVKRALEHLGYRVYAAESRAAAIDLLKTSDARVDLVLSDVVLPELHRRVLGAVVNDANDGPRLLYMSGEPDVVALVHQLVHPGITLLRKPFSAYSLAEAVRRSLDARL